MAAARNSLASGNTADDLIETEVVTVHQKLILYSDIC